MRNSARRRNADFGVLTRHIRADSNPPLAAADTKTMQPTIASKLLVSIAILFSSMWTVAATAQPFGKTVVATYGMDDLTRANDLAQRIERELTARRVNLISMHDARDRFLTRSRPPQAPTGSDLEALAREARAAVQHAALGRTAAAQRGVREIMALAEHSLESLNRETKTARQLLDTCLALVRVSLHGGKRDQAIEQAMHCRRLVPDLAPSESLHPATVVGALAEADDQLRRMRVGTLHVMHQGDRVCSVYLNGRHLGTTPFTLDQAPVGEYRVQVECAPQPPGRVHVVQLGDAPVQLTVDTQFDGHVQTDPRLALSYTDPEEQRIAVVEHAKEIGNEVRADDLLLVRAHETEVTLLRVQARHKRLVGAVKLTPSEKGLSDEEIAQAVDALSAARFVGLTLDDFLPKAAEEPDLQVHNDLGSPVEPVAPPQQEAKPLVKKWWFWTAIGVAAVGGVTAGVLIAKNRNDDKPRTPTISADVDENFAAFSW